MTFIVITNAAKYSGGSGLNFDGVEARAKSLARLALSLSLPHFPQNTNFSFKLRYFKKRMKNFARDPFACFHKIHIRVFRSLLPPCLPRAPPSFSSLVSYNLSFGFNSWQRLINLVQIFRTAARHSIPTNINLYDQVLRRPFPI